MPGVPRQPDRPNTHPRRIYVDQNGRLLPLLPELLQTEGLPNIVEFDLPHVHRVPNVFACQREHFSELVRARPDIAALITFTLRTPNNQVIFQLRDQNNDDIVYIVSPFVDIMNTAARRQ